MKKKKKKTIYNNGQFIVSRKAARIHFLVYLVDVKQYIHIYLYLLRKMNANNEKRINIATTNKRVRHLLNKY